MSASKISAAFFGGFINCYNRAGEVLDFKHAFRSDEFAGQEFFNQAGKPTMPELTAQPPLFNREHPLDRFREV